MLIYGHEHLDVQAAFCSLFCTAERVTDLLVRLRRPEGKGTKFTKGSLLRSAPCQRASQPLLVCLRLGAKGRKNSAAARG